nr:putative colanic acid biosynthesis acetyltransferase [Rhodococcus koreensis]
MNNDSTRRCANSDRDLSQFVGFGYDKGRGKIAQVSWMTVSGLIFMRWWCPNTVRLAILRLFGASVGRNVLIRHRVRIHWPWKLSIDKNSWIGEGVWILNLEPVTIGSNVCVSQDVFLCTGSHKFSSPSFEFDNGSIVIEDGAWLAAQSTILRGVRIGNNSLIGAKTLIFKDVPARCRVLAPGASHTATPPKPANEGPA